MARRWTELGAEISAHEHELERLTREVAPKMVGAFGIGTGTAATRLIAAGDNPERLRSGAAFAALCGVCPVPASSGKTSWHRLNRGGNHKANAALYQIVVVRLGRHQPAIEFAQRRMAEGEIVARSDSLSERLRRSRCLRLSH